MHADRPRSSWRFPPRPRYLRSRSDFSTWADFMQPPRGMASVRTQPGRPAGPAQRRRLRAAEELSTAGDLPAEPPLFPQAGGPWRLTRLIAPGGSIAIYRARPASEPLGPGCYVIKTSAPGGDPIGRAMLAREALVAAGVHHAGVVSVLSAHLCQQRPHLVLPYLEGASLGQILAAATATRPSLSPLPISRALAIARQTAAALAALHAGGWLHGQVRPAHILVSPQGHATLIDLTLARRLGTAECDAVWHAPQHAVYSAPDSFGGGPCIAAARDIYSLGIVLFEMLTGRPPFESPDPRKLAMLHRRCRAPDLRHFVPQASLELSELMRRMLAKEPLRRPTDEQLVRWLAEIEIAELAA